MIVRTIDGFEFLYSTGSALGSGVTAIVYKSNDNLTDVAIKISREINFNSYIEAEFDVLTKLSRYGGEGASYLPYDFKLGETDDGRRALIMKPLLEKTVIGEIKDISDPTAREKFILLVAKQYICILKAMAVIGKNCQDKKLSDFWWYGDRENGHLIVTDWNVVNNEENQLLDVRRFGLLWYELIVENQLQTGVVLSRDDYDAVKERVSYGLWYMLGRCIGSSMGAQIASLDELSALVERIIEIYSMGHIELLHMGRTLLQNAEERLDRVDADFSWVCFDLSKRISGIHSHEMERALSWAKDPLSQYASSLIEDLSSPVYSMENILSQLNALNTRAHGSQESGDISRFMWVVDFIGLANDHLMRNSSVDRALLRDKLLTLQKELVRLSAHLTRQKNGVHKELLSHVESVISLSPELTDKFVPFSSEIVFWELYYSLTEDAPDDEFLRLKNLRESISYLGDHYDPTLRDLDERMHASQKLRRYLHLKGKTEKEAEVAKRNYLDRLPLCIDESTRWQETVSELLFMKRKYLQDSAIEKDFRQMLQELLQKDNLLKNDRKNLFCVSLREKILISLTEIKKEFPGLEGLEYVDDEYEKNRNLKKKIIYAQENIFSNPGLVLNDAMRFDYEVFVSPSMSVAALKFLFESGQWDKNRFDHEVENIKGQSEHFRDLSIVLDEKIGDLERLFDKFQIWDEEVKGATIDFFVKIVRLYLASALVKIDKNEHANKILDRAMRVLEFLKNSDTEQVEYERYIDLYEHLVEMDKKKIDIKSIRENEEIVVDQMSTRELEHLFEDRRYDEISEQLPSIIDEKKRKHWETVLNDHNIFVGVSQQVGLLNTYAKDDRVKILEKCLGSLRNLANDKQQYYMKSKSEIDDLYARLWSLLYKENRKAASGFAVNIGVVNEK